MVVVLLIRESLHDSLETQSEIHIDAGRQIGGHDHPFPLRDLLVRRYFQFEIAAATNDADSKGTAEPSENNCNFFIRLQCSDFDYRIIAHSVFSFFAR